MNVKTLYSDNYKNNICFTDYFQKRDRNVLILTHFREENEFYDYVNSVILEELMRIDVYNISWDTLNETIKLFFVDLNWKLNALFRPTVEMEKGVTLALIVTEKEKVYYVKFGRFLSGIIAENKKIEWDEDWASHRVKTKEELCLLGSIEKDISVKPVIVELPKGSSLVLCSADCVPVVDPSSLNSLNVKSTLTQGYDRKPFSYCVVENVKKAAIRKDTLLKTIWAKKFRITIFLMLLMLAFSSYYYFRGDNRVEDRLHVIREQFQLGVRNIDFLKIQEILPLDYGVLFVPQRNIELFVEWESTLPFTVTAQPNFDLKQIFIPSNEKLYSYDKINKKNNWTFNSPNEISAVEILDANLMVVTTVFNESFCLKRDTGEIIWEKKGTQTSYLGKQKPFKPIQISLEMDRRLNRSIVLLPDIKSLSLLNILNGDTLYYYEAKSDIDYISDFDLIEKSIYMVKGNRLYKVRFDIKT